MRPTPLLLIALSACLGGGDAPVDDTDETADTEVVDTDETADTEVVDTDPVETDDTDDVVPTDDLDRDGWTVAEGDCNDGDASIHPFAYDAPYDGVDANCRQDSDYDADYDGHDAEAWGGDDCNDNNAAIRPSATDRPYDGIDSDCSGGSDDDADGDGYDAATRGGDDCNDFDDQVHPGATEIWYDGRDQDCAGGSDWDADGDGQDVLTHGGLDCDDTDDTIYAGAPDVPYDGVNADCSGFSDDDADEDGHEAIARGGDDCDDTNDRIYPGAPELCTDVDESCDGDPYADAIDLITWFTDGDDDGWGGAFLTESCVRPPASSDQDGDCDDGDDSVYPGAAAVPCDGTENDCEATTLEPTGGVFLGAQSYVSLSAAFAAAAAGDTLELCEGLHRFPSQVIDKAITITGRSEAAITRLEPSAGGAVFDVRTADLVTLRRLTLAGGTGARIRTDDRGGGLYVHDGGSVRLEGVIVRDNYADYGGGIWLGVGASGVLVDTVVTKNIADAPTVGKGGGVVVDRDAVLVLDGSHLRDNYAEQAGGLWLGERGTLLGLAGAAITLNEALLGAGGITAILGGAVIEGVEVSGNEGTVGAGIEGANLTVRDTTVTANYAELVGGGLRLAGENLLERVSITANTSGIEAGGLAVYGLTLPEPGIYDDGDPDNDPTPALTMVDCSVLGNTADDFLGSAGGIVVNHGAFVSVNTNWGAAGGNPPVELTLFEDSRSYNRAGTVTEICIDGTGEGCF